MWLICRAALGSGKNKLLIRGVHGAEWVFCPLIKITKGDRISTDRCQKCKHFIRLEQTYVPQTRISGKIPFFKSFQVARPSGRLKTPRMHTSLFPPIPGLIGEREPLVDLFEEDHHLLVLAELPGVDEKDVNIKVEENTLTISATTATGKYLKKVELPTPIKKGTIKSIYRNNILQVRLMKKNVFDKSNSNVKD